MKRRLHFSVGEWREALCVVGFFCLAWFVTPHPPLFVRIAFGTLITGCVFWSVASALSERWHESKTVGAFFGYYVRLGCIGLAFSLCVSLLGLTVGFAIGKLFYGL